MTTGSHLHGFRIQTSSRELFHWDLESFNGFFGCFEPIPPPLHQFYPQPPSPSPLLAPHPPAPNNSPFIDFRLSQGTPVVQYLLLSCQEQSLWLLSCFGVASVGSKGSSLFCWMNYQRIYKTDYAPKSVNFLAFSSKFQQLGHAKSLFCSHFLQKSLIPHLIYCYSQHFYLKPNCLLYVLRAARYAKKLDQSFFQEHVIGLTSSD